MNITAAEKKKKQQQGIQKIYKDLTF